MFLVNQYVQKKVMRDIIISKMTETIKLLDRKMW